MSSPQNLHQQQNNNTYQPAWTPQVVQDLITRQFLRNEDVSSIIPPLIPGGAVSVDGAPNNNNNKILSSTINNNNNYACMKLPDWDPSIRALQKYCENGPSVPTNSAFGAGATAANKNMMANGTPSKNRPPLAYNGSNTNQQQSQQQQPNFNNGAPGTPRVNAQTKQQQQQAGNNNRSRTPGGGTPRNESEARADASAPLPNNAASASATVDYTKRRLYNWPISVPTDNMLKGTSRSQLQPQTEKRIAAQAEVDPDLIFRQETMTEFPLAQIFAKFPSALKVISQNRGLSGDWRNDTFSAEEEAQYKADMGFTVMGPSQAVQLQHQHLLYGGRSSNNTTSSNNNNSNTRMFGGELMNNNNNFVHQGGQQQQPTLLY